jgi:segregation and condensation protein A
MHPDVTDDAHSDSLDDAPGAEETGPDEGPGSSGAGGQATRIGSPPHAGPRPTLLGGADDRAYNLELPQFEGPLDLLLHLVRRHELDILDIPISFVCEKYLEYLAFMQALDLEVAGDYLVMAATLAYLKSRELVPADPDAAEEDTGIEEDGPDPREELIARLLEYQKFRQAAADLDRLPMSGRDVFGRGGSIELPPVDPGLSPITLYRLAESYHRILERARIHKTHEVVLERVTVAARMEQLVLLLGTESRFEFEALFLDREWSSEAELRSMLVVTLMSILELTKLGIVHVHQPHDSPTIVVERKTTLEEARRALSGYDETASFGEAASAGDTGSGSTGSDSGNHV